MKRKLSAVEARKKLGEILEGVYYRGDEVVIERAGKPMAVVIPAGLYATLERDREVLGAAVAGQANYLVTNDDALLGLKSYQGIEIVSAARFVAILGS